MSETEKSTIVIDSDAYDAIVEHARAAAPEEACGMLAGEFGEDRSVAVEARPAENASPVPEQEYEIDPAEQFELMTEIEDAGREVAGFYHSHPRGPDGPSATDEARATWDGYSYVIVSLDGEPAVGSWRWDGERFEQEVLRRLGDDRQ